MAYGQVDPARLQGDALRRWYLRSPDDIARERSAASARAYDRFFNAGGAAPVPPDAAHAAQSADPSHDGAILWAADPENRWRDARSGKGFAAGSRYAAAAQPAADGADCISCHGRLKPPALPWPRPWPADRSLRDAPASPSSKPPEPDRKQCEQQLQSDTDICGQQPNNASKGICREDAMKRYAHCRRTGEVGVPYLFTVPRMPR